MKVTCDYNISTKCKGTYESTARNIRASKAVNGGKILCKYCSGKMKMGGRNNPSSKFNIDDKMFENINTPEKAWILGWIASDGYINKNGFISIEIHKKDIDVLEKIKKIVCEDLKIVAVRNNVRILICSKSISEDICKHLNIGFGKKCETVNFPTHIDDSLKWHFIRGLFEGDGNIVNPTLKSTPECSIASYSLQMKEKIKDFVKIQSNLRHDDKKKTIEWYGVNCMDFMGKIYDNISNTHIRMNRKYELYERWISWVPMVNGKGNSGRFDKLFWAKTNENAFPLKKERISDSGYDITIIGISKQIGDVVLYSTGIKISPPHGIYFDLVPRSSIIKSGYILANNIGIIDRSYRGEILVPLIKIDKNAPDLQFPSRLVQLIPRIIPHIELSQVSNLEDTDRGSGGFGSTGK